MTSLHKALNMTNIILLALLILALPAMASGGGRHEIAFIDSGVQDAQVLADGIRPGVEVIRLDAGRDGVVQMGEALAGRRDVQAVHVISHGAPGKVFLGTGVLSAETLLAYAAEMQRISRSLRQGGELLFYGCNVASGVEGGGFVEALAHTVRAGVAASTTPTGTKTLGGNWELEFSVGGGKVDAAVLGSAIGRYDHLLASIGSSVTATFNSYVWAATPSCTSLATNWNDTVSGFTFKYDDGWSTAIYGCSNYGSGNGPALTLSGGSSQVETLTITNTSSSTFKFSSFYLNTTDPNVPANHWGHGTWTVEGFRGAVSTGTQTVNTGTDGVSNTGVVGTITLNTNNNFNNVDKIVISSTSSGFSGVLLDSFVFDPAVYTVTFNANGGSGSMTPQTASSATNLTANSFTRTGYIFAGWNTAANGSGTAYANQASYPFTADVTLYAQWTVAISNLIFALDDGYGSTYGGYHLAGYNATTGKYSIIANPNPVGFDGFNSALYLYSGQIYTMAMDATNSPTTGKLARFNGTDIEYLGSNTFYAIKKFTEFDSKLYFIGTNVDASYTETSYLYYFDPSNSTITQATNGDNSVVGTTVLTAYGSAVYYWGNTAAKSNVMLKWDGSTVTEVLFGGNNLVDVRGPAVEVGGILYFWSKAGTETDYSIFKLNGTTLTRLYGPMAAVNAPWDLVLYNNKLFFNLGSPSDNGKYSVRSVDLTTAAMTIEHAPTVDGSMNYQVFSAAGNLYFLYYPNDGTGWNLYKYNSTNNITKVTSLNTPTTAFTNLTTVGTNIYFSASTVSGGSMQELYRYDVTGGTVTKVSSFNPSTDPAELTFTNYNGSPTVSGLTGIINYTVPLAPLFDYVRDVRGAVASGGSVSVAPNLQLRDLDGTNLTGATVSIVSGYSAGDTLSFTAGSGITGSYSGGTLTLSGTATVANYEAVLRTVVFAPDATAGERQIHFRATDTDAKTSSSTALTARAIIEVTTAAGHVDSLTFASMPTGLSTTNYVSTFSVSDSVLGTIVFKTTNDPLTTAQASLTGSASGTTAAPAGTDHGLLYDATAQTMNVVLDSDTYSIPKYLAIYSSNGSEFDFQGFSIDDSTIGYWNTAKVQITGFRNGVQVVQEDYHVMSPGSTKVILPSNFNNVDEVRIGNPSGGFPAGTYSAVSGKFANFVILVQGAATHTVTFNPNGGSGSMTPQTASSAANLTANSFTRTGYTFSGWNTAVNGSGTAYANGASYAFTADVTLYAQWLPIAATLTITVDGSGTVTSHNQGGTNYSCNTPGVCPAMTFGYNDSVTLSATGSNSTFSSWGGAISGNANPFSDLLMDGDKAVTATFTANPALAKISGIGTVYYTLISALAECGGDATILARDTSFGGGLTVSSHTITLRGGFPDATFSGDRSGYTTLTGPLAITGGKLIAERVKVMNSGQ